MLGIRRLASASLQRTATSSTQRMMFASSIESGSSLGSVYGSERSEVSDEEYLKALKSGKLSHHKLEAVTGEAVRAINLRRQFIYDLKGKTADGVGGGIPVESIEGESFYNQVNGANCETVIGFIPIPVGIAGPLVLDGVSYHVPMATTEGALVASTNRGARAISLSGGACTVIYQDGMTRAPALQCSSLTEAAEVKAWIDQPQIFKLLQQSFASTTKYGQLNELKVKLVGRFLHVKLRCTTGDAMGMNMIGKGSNEVVNTIISKFPGVRLMALSGNVCTDKKPAAVNWIEGRGKSAAAEAVIPAAIVKDVLKTSVKGIVEVNTAKNLVGSAIAGTMGGNNAHAANVVTACFLATGQDPAQNVESSNCLTFMEETPEGDLRISVTMPCIEVGTVGGGTALPAQKSALQLLGVAGAHPDVPGTNAKQLARIIVGTVLAGELSLMAALSANHLISAHMQLNRKPAPSSSKKI
jgi:hydroxymethylglutaryl-CoA reductase (NADPH)